MRILAALTRVDAGQAGVAGFDVRRDRSAVRRRISLTGQFATLDEAQTGEENLRMMGRLSRLSRKVVSRSNPEPWYRSDATYFERLYGEALIDLSPEEVADGVRARAGDLAVGLG